MPNYTIKDLQEFAENKGGKCLSEKYEYNETSYDWECENGHKFSLVWLNVKCRGRWCRYCKSGTGMNVMEKFAKDKGGDVLTKEFSGNDATYEWICKNNHVWENTWRRVQKRKVWCDECIKDEKLQEMKEWAKKSDGECLSEEFIDNKEIYRWKCSQNHEWENSWQNIKWQGSWCQKCRCWTLENLQILAESRGEKCLSHIIGTSFGAHGRYLWQCKKGHQFECQGGNLIYKSICSQCNKLSIEEMKNIAEKRGGKCLSQVYINKRTKLQWQCEKGHIWKAKPNSIKGNNTWCPQCAYDNNKWKIDIELITEINNSTKIEDKIKYKCKNGHICESPLINLFSGDICKICEKKTFVIERRRKAIDKIYKFVEIMGGKINIDNESLIREEFTENVCFDLECKNNHKWKTTVKKLKSGVWCQKCRYLSESVCEDIFIELTNKEFIKVRPPWLERLELDGYCEELNCAFEYSGRQHYEYIKFFHGDKDLKNFEKQQERDIRKSELCKEKGITLIVVPYIYTFQDKDKMKEYINNKLVEYNIIVDIEFID